MYLLHNTDETKIFKILSDGKLKSSSKTKNVRMYGWQEGSKYIYLRLNQKNEFANLYLDHKLLLENVFYLHTGWLATPKTEKIDGRKLTLEQLNKILLDFRKEVKKNHSPSIMMTNESHSMPLMMTNEILIKNNIDLHKYLKKIKITNMNSKTVNILNNLYQNVIVHNSDS